MYSSIFLSAALATSGSVAELDSAISASSSGEPGKPSELALARRVVVEILLHRHRGAGAVGEVPRHHRLALGVVGDRVQRLGDVAHDQMVVHGDADIGQLRLQHGHQIRRDLVVIVIDHLELPARIPAGFLEQFLRLLGIVGILFSLSLLNGPFGSRPSAATAKPPNTLSTIAFLSIAYSIAWRTRTSDSGLPLSACAYAAPQQGCL